MNSSTWTCSKNVFSSCQLVINSVLIVPITKSCTSWIAGKLDTPTCSPNWSLRNGPTELLWQIIKYEYINN